MSTTKRATIADVAKLAGVGKVTVSYVLNGQSRTARISEDTERRIIAAAQSLNYRKNPLGRMLATKQTDVLAVVFQRGYFFMSWSNFTAEVMRGVAAAAVDLGYDLMLHTRDVADDQEASVLADGRVDGALVLRDGRDPLADELAKHGLPTVQFFTRNDHPDHAFVDADNYSGGRMATRHLLELGHRRIAIVRGPHGSTSSNDRFNGYRDALESAGLTVRPEDVLVYTSPSDDMSELTRLMTADDRPTALFVWSDEVAFGCLAVLRAAGLDVPGDVSVVGFDSLEQCNRSIPPLTSIRQPVAEMAQEATRLLVSIIRGETPERKQIIYPLVLDVRGSTAPCSYPIHKEVEP